MLKQALGRTVLSGDQSPNPTYALLYSPLQDSSYEIRTNPAPTILLSHEQGYFRFAQARKGKEAVPDQVSGR